MKENGSFTPTKRGWAAISHVGGTLGNVATYFNGGLEMRLGWNIPENFGVSLIRPAGSTSMGVSCRPSFYLLGAFDSRLVFRDIFLDGNTFTHSHSVDKKPLVADLAAGAACSYGRFMLTFTQVLRTKEFKKQDDRHSFGAIPLSCFFSF